MQAKISNAKTNYSNTTFDNSKIYKHIRGITKSKSFPSTMYHIQLHFKEGEYGKPGMPEQPGSAGTDKFLRLESRASSNNTNYQTR